MTTVKHKNIIDVDQTSFQNEVIQRSHQTPVVVDFWAPWCGPCRMLGPVLERLALEPNSNFILAKVNADHNPQLSMQYGVQGIPAVKAFVNGRVVDEFVGAQPEPRVRQFLQRLPAVTRPQPRPENRPHARSSDPSSRLALAKRLLRQGKGCEAQAQLQGFPAGGEAVSAQRLLPLAEFQCQVSRSVIGGSSEMDVMYQQAGDAVRRRDFGAAMYHLLAVLRRDPHFRSDQASKVMSGLFELLGESDPLTQAYRQQLAALAPS
jgi:putative thioredoxin